MKLCCLLILKKNNNIACNILLFHYVTILEKDLEKAKQCILHGIVEDNHDKWVCFQRECRREFSNVLENKLIYQILRYQNSCLIPIDPTKLIFFVSVTNGIKNFISFVITSLLHFMCTYNVMKQ